MKRLISLLVASAVMLHADDTNATTPPTPPPAPVNEATVSHQGFPASRYEMLWTHSPFAVETPEQDVTESAEYSLVGVAELNGVSYASLIEKQNQNHLFISSDKPINGLTLNSIQRTGSDTYATLTRDGQPLTLKLETIAANTPLQSGAPTNGSVPMPGTTTPGLQQPNIPMPGSGTPQTFRPLIHIHRPPVRVPPRQYNGQIVPQPAGQPPPPPPAP